MKHSVGRRWLCLGSLAALGAPLAGCGFQPVYMRTASGKTGVAQRELSTVFVENIPERPGQVLRLALQERLGDDSGTSANYDLRVSFGVAGQGIATEIDDISTYLRLIGTANWALLAHDPKRTILTSGSAQALDGVNIFDSQYFAADLEVEAEQKRIAENVATQIATQLATWFREKAAKEAKAAAAKEVKPAQAAKAD
jgi:LPS-assembly lipoprotein